MKLALIADIHGNMFAFDAILEDIRRHNVDQLLCLGDVAAGGPQPHEVIQRLRELACPIVMGNTDAWLLEPVLKEHVDTFSKYTQDIEYWSAQQLSAEDKAFIKTFQPTIEWPLDDNKTLLAYHGTPRSFTERLLATTPDAQLDEIFTSTTAQILVGAHTHIQLYRRYRDKIILNPGSVGMPMDRTWPFDAIRNTPGLNMRS